MAILSDDDRKGIWAELMREVGIAPGDILKADFRAAVDAVDDWVDANAAALNSAIPQPARGLLTTKQKAALLSAVVLKRYKVS